MGTSMAVQVKGLNVTVSSGFPRRKTTTILQGVDFEVKTGEITGLLGPSGSGKTTLMRSIVGVQTHTGTLEVFGQPAGASSLRGNIGYVTQQASVYQDLTVLDNLRYFAALAGGPSKTRAPEEILEVLNISGLAHRRVDTLSGGQRSRTSLGCALITSPQLLVMDEPTV
ncbi:ABC transporter ATPase [Corynebacterium suranareeae]|uniref:ABC transporter ATPase n=1 Tax=Corynebacterium suranareeae TaxID=2506452 RepID=A0A169RWE6_9CORY|nr:ABC transporter ATP-binding protein [Corynebacterium suranareeae]BAU95808.1 ABC transporter ATPase [Corynebacterium suranareeae]